MPNHMLRRLNRVLTTLAAAANAGAVAADGHVPAARTLACLGIDRNAFRRIVR